jgi:hypothetical protein
LTDKRSKATKDRQTKDRNNQKIERSKRSKFSGNFLEILQLATSGNKKTNEKKKNCMKSKNEQKKEKLHEIQKQTKNCMKSSFAFLQL